MAQISEEIINDIRKRTDIVEVISRYLPLTKKGNNCFGVCPFHDDHSPSMSVSPEKQIFTCFSCGATGNVFTFVSDYEHISFVETVRLLGSKLGYNLEHSTRIDNPHQKDLEIYKLATKFYQNNINTALGKNAIKYLEDRKIDRETMKKFEIGLAIQKVSLTDYLKSKNVSLDKMIELGITNNTGNDTFVNRIIFPLYDLSGNIVAFSGRIYNTKDSSKYLNTKETPLFKKRQLLYNYHRAHEHLRKNDYIIVMEGFMDVIRASTVGINNCVATMGTSFTKEHANLVKKMTDNIILCFDGDEAGEEATTSAIKVLEEINVEPKIIRLEDYKDPDEYIINKGKDAFLNKIANAISVIDFKMQLLRHGKNLKDINDISSFLEETIKELTKTKDDIVVELTLRKMAQEFNISYDTLYQKYQQYNKPKEVNQPRPKTIVQNNDQNKTQYEKAELSLIYYMLKDSEVINIVEKKVGYFPTPTIRYLSNEIIAYYHKYGQINEADFISYISDKEELKQALSNILSLNNRPEFNKEQTNLMEIDDYIISINKYVKDKKIKELEQSLRNESDMRKQLEIINEISKIKGVKLC